MNWSESELNSIRIELSTGRYGLVDRLSNRLGVDEVSVREKVEEIELRERVGRLARKTKKRLKEG